MEFELSLKTGIGALLLLVCGGGFAMLQSGCGLLKGATGSLVNAVVAGLFSTVGFLGIGAAVLFGSDPLLNLNFDPLELWGKSAEVYNIALACWLNAFAVVFTIVPLGVAAGRLKWSGVAAFAFLNGALIFPIISRWIWSASVTIAPNQGWLEAIDFKDFGGISLIGAGAGAAGLAIAVAVGPRRGRFSDNNGAPFYLPPGNILLAIGGVAVIGLSWLGFAIGFPGASSVSSTFTEKVFVLLATTVASGIVSLLAYRLVFGAISAPVFIQSIIGGLVAGLTICSEVSSALGLAVGAVAGILVVFATLLLEKMRVDDVSGVIPAHLFCGLWGMIAVSLFGGESMNTQLIAGSAIAVSVGAATFCLVQCLKRVGCFVITKDQEKLGLDFVQHGISTSSGDE